MFIKQAFKPDNKYWKYLAGSAIVILAAIIGQFPLAIGILIKSFKEGDVTPTDQSEMLRYLDLNLTLFLIMLSFVFAFVALYFVITKFHNQKFKTVITTRPRVDWKRIFFAFLLWGSFSAATTIYDYYVHPDNYVLQFDLPKFAILFIIAIIFIPIQTSVEELVFRGYLMQGFGRLGLTRWFPLLMTSVIFGLMHMANPEVVKMGGVITIYYIGTGLFLGILTLMDEGMELSLGFHAANNLVAALLVTADWTVFQTYSVFKDLSEPTAGYAVVLPVIIIYPILLFIFSKKYNWHNWKEKLTGKLELPINDSINQTPSPHE
ncbi:CPBP family intramembrane glutamic endopeptidase [Flavobacterium alkalisoli]|uniref:CPBP family intramembrane glutamic endopeptidase n=1 Tax=Flavobacterium alkalisoli TaxID=2602769 RepID=UPI003A918383